MLCQHQFNFNCVIFLTFNKTNINHQDLKPSGNFVTNKIVTASSLYVIPNHVSSRIIFAESDKRFIDSSRYTVVGFLSVRAGEWR